MTAYRSYLIYRGALESYQQAALELLRLYRLRPSPESLTALVATSQVLSEVTRQAPLYPRPARRPSAIVQVDREGKVIYRS